MKKSNKDTIAHKYNKKQIIICGIFLIYIISFVTIFGRYATNRINNFFSRSKEFYFYSDKLSQSNPNYQIDNWSGVDDYTIVINMNSNENNLLSATYDINYDISYTCSNNVICQLSKTSGVILSSTNTDFFNLIITPNTALRTGDRVYVRITATARSNYDKVLRANFTLIVGQENLTYEIKDSANSPYLLFNITNTLSYYVVSQPFNTYSIGDRINIDTYLALSNDNKNKCYSALVTLDFNPQYVVLDMTSNAYLNATQITNTTVNTYNYINRLTFKVDALSSQTVRFYKVDSTQNYTYPITNNTPIITLTSI